MSSIQTVAQLRNYLGLIVFLAKHIRRSTDVFKILRKIAGQDGKMKIKWEDNNGFFAKEFEKSKKALKELVALTPYDPLKPAFVLVDSSFIGTGAILYQKDESGNNVIVEFYSRKRPDSERKNNSSCVLETAGMVGCLNFRRRYLQDSQFPVTVYTDSASLAAVAARFARNEIPSDVNLINKCFSNILGIQVKVIHVPGKSIQIQGVDIISRDSNLPECVGENCDICKLASLPNELPTQFINQVKPDKFLPNFAELSKNLRQKYNFNVKDEPENIFIDNIEIFIFLETKVINHENRAKNRLFFFHKKTHL